MSSQSNCSSAWNQLITAINQDKTNFGTLIQPYGPEICNLLNGKVKEGGTLIYEDVKKAFYDLKAEIDILKENSKSLGTSLEAEKNENKQKIETLESRNYKQGVGLGLGIPAAGAAGAGAVIGLPLLVKLLKGVFTRS